VFQSFNLWQHMTVLQNVIEAPVHVLKVRKPDAIEKAEALLNRVGLYEKKDQYPAFLSGGQQQRAAIARALANDPALIIADEPTGSLDSRTAGQIFELFRQLAAGGKTILMVTHDEDLARRVDRAILIADGEVVNEYLARALQEIGHDQLVEVKRRAVSRRYPAGATVVYQGERGHEFFILLEGEADVLVERPGGGEIQVGRLHPGQCFGETALTGDGVRTATVRAAADTPVVVAALDAESFHRLVDTTPALRERLGQIVERNQIRNQIQTLAALPFQSLLDLTRDLRAQTFPPGATILRQGALGDTFFFVLEGMVEVMLQRPDGAEVLIDRLAAGQFFGELALLGNGRRMANVRAADAPARVVELSRGDFEQIIGHSPVFREQVERVASQRRQVGGIPREDEP
jgi:putative ABC transport system ATP-binding protein